MKITINFNQEEKHSIINMLLNAGNLKEVKDESEHIVGNFGEVKYDHVKNEITLDFKTNFIKAYTALLMSLIGIIKTFMGNCEMFAYSWFNDTKDLMKKDEEESSNKTDFTAEVDAQRE